MVIVKLQPTTAGGRPSSSAPPVIGPHPTYAEEKATLIRVAILPEGFPAASLTAEELSGLQESVMDEMLTSAWSGPVVFRGIHFRVGNLTIDYLDKGSAEWLKTVVPQGVPLETRTGADIPAAYNATLFCPRSSDRSNEEILAFIGFQNRVETDAWKVIHRKNDGAGALLVVGMR
ncbi:uncharacterized protein LOC128264381 [Drosophila gunungcola]|uniref:uncharacterized protein LOC128264381 n=1 Tax=Drosophila gunungcola TaxID=103775 RepID=UPI0022E32955|nr:uncharacterized protein LOC128264381 [Drosophila gunungcola]